MVRLLNNRWTIVTTRELTEEEFLCALMLGLGVGVSKFRKIDDRWERLGALYATLNWLIKDWKGAQSGNVRQGYSCIVPPAKLSTREDKA